MAFGHRSPSRLGKGRVAPRCIPEGKSRRCGLCQSCRLALVPWPAKRPAAEGAAVSESPAPALVKKRAPWRGRRRVSDAKEKFIAVRCTEEDRAFIAETAAQAGLSVGAFLRALAVGSAGPRAVKRPRAEREELARLLGEIGKLGSNINQIARWTNTVKSPPSAGTLAQMRDDIALMRAEVMKALDRGD